MGIELASAFIRVRADGSKLTGDFGGIQQAANRALQGIASTAAGIGQSVYQGVSGALQGVSGPMAAVTGQLAKSWDLLKSGIEQAGVFEKQTVKMETMMGSAEATKKVMDDLTKFAVETPFEMPGIVQVATQMIQVGDRGDDLMKTLKMLGDASGGSAAEFQLMGTVFNQVRGAGALFTQDFRQLSSRGIISLNDLAKHFNVSAAEADKMMTTGKIKFPEFKKMLMGLTAEGGRYHDMAKKQAQTIEGLNSTLKDAINITLRMLVTPLVPFVKSVTNAYIQMTSVAQSMVEQGGKLVSFAFAGAAAFGVLGKTLATGAFLMRLFGLSIKGLLIGSGIGIIFVAAGAALGAFIGLLAESTEVTEAFGKIWTDITSVFTDLGEDISQYFNSRLGEWAEIKMLFEEVMGAIGISVSNFVTDAVNLFNQLFGFTQDGLFGMFKGVMTFIRDTLDFLSLMATNWKKMWTVISINTTIFLYQMITPAVVTFNTIVGVVMGAGAAMWSIMKDTGSNIMMVFSAVTQSIMGMFKGLWAGIKNKAFGDGNFMKGFSDAFNAEIAKIEGDNASLGKMAENAGNAFNKAMTENMGADNPFKEEIEALRKAGAEITQEVIDERELNRRMERDWDRALATRAKKEEEDEKKKGAAKPPLRVSLESGMYSFTGIADKIQDKLLGKGKDHGAEQVELAKAGLTVQKEQLNVQKTMAKGVPGTLVSDK